MNILVAIDVGTTNCKVGVYSDEGRQVVLLMAATELRGERKSGQFYDPIDIWDQVCMLSQKAMSELHRCCGELLSIRGICVTGMAEAGLLLDGKGEPITTIIPWFDLRTIAQAKAFEGLLCPEEAFCITGLPPHYIYSMYKLLWLRDTLPNEYDRATHWLNVPDYISFKLSGQYGTSYSMASRTMLFDVTNRCWSEKLLSLSNIPYELLPESYPSGYVLGVVTFDACEASGLPEGTPVVVGGHDHLCCALAGGVFEEGTVLDSSGTAEPIIATTNTPIINEKTYASGFSVGCHSARDRYYLLSGLDLSGGVVEWTIQTFLGANEGVEKDSRYEEFILLAEASLIGGDGLFFLPYLGGCGSSRNDIEARGAFVGLRPNHTRSEVCRAVLEGLCYEVKYIINLYEELLGNKIWKIVAMGGGTKNSLWTRIKASVTGIPISIPRFEQGTLVGAAMLAGIGAGVFQSEEHGAKVFALLGNTVQPDEVSSMKYQEYFDTVYSKLYYALKEINLGISNLVMKHDLFL